MKYTEKCYYFVSALGVDLDEKEIFYRYENICSRPWPGMLFAPTIDTIKKNILAREPGKIREFINRELSRDWDKKYRRKGPTGRVR